jgi:hypothetical protein
MGSLRNLGLVTGEATGMEAPIVALLENISDMDEERVIAIPRPLSQATVFNDVVRRQVEAMDVGTRYERITNDFDSIREDARAMVEQIEDGQLTTRERLANVWMKATRGDIASRFERIKSTYLEVSAATQDQLRRENVVLEAYQDFRTALKQAEVLAHEVLEKAQAELDAAKAQVEAAMTEVESYADGNAADRARLELARDERVRELQNSERRFQIAKDLADNLTIGYNTSEVVMARLMQSHTAKERVNAQAGSFFSTNETVLTALTASFTGLSGLHESTRTLNAMKEGVDRSLETLSEVGAQVQEEAVRAGYGPTVQAESVKRLVESVVNFQERSREIITEMRELSTTNAQEIREVVEDGKRRLAQLARQAEA